MTSPEPQTDFGKELSQTSYEPPQQKWRWWRLLLALILILGGGVAIAWRLITPIHQTPSTTAQLSGVRAKISSVQIGTIEESSDYIASLESRRSINLQSRIPGQVTQIFVKPGDTVTTGTPIIQIDYKPQQATVVGNNGATQVAAVLLENARSTLRALEVERLSKVADVRLNQLEYEKYATLADQGAVSRQSKDFYADRLATAKTNLGAVDSRIQAQKASIFQAETAIQQVDTNIRQQPVQLQYDKITAPFSGTVGDIPVKIGDFVNNSARLVTVAQHQPLEVTLSLPLERSSQLRKGMPVEIINAQGEILGTSRVFLIAPNVNNEPQSILIKALFNNAQGQLRAGQLVRTRIIWSQRSGVLIPTTAVTRVAGETFVYVAKTETTPQGVSQLVAQQRRVKLGNIKRNYYQVLAGLQPEDEIIISGLLNVRDGVPIVPES
ncbi:efflux RND transporter periplasmic adaptor subunit [Fortiea sp. LEGE XX443]|uniref:efflux RND transporter periplasmic adaptor subunit n=1 Tax=Fortiea sp. LEGE XX443 TaxID=1828611 RepID=UPI00188030E6|nr:efflux RND transporter periplasmic adaptor subunit [Fortiea sp. LEGE XX443]MBE9005435.1 efflux RND transporter periplasmic adaptor subunit [Fortiea sp. LEGE XX443]